MASHCSSIGLPIRDQADFAALPDRVGPEAVPIESTHGVYWKWSSECGAELWLQTNTDNELIGITPCFSGVSRIRVRLTARVSRPNDTALEGAFLGWADPDDDHTESGAYPFVFDAVDADQYGALTLPLVVDARVAAFAHEMTVYPSIDAYNATQIGEVKIASQSFIPSGLFSPGGGAISPPKSMAIFTGHVVAAEVKTNQLTGAKYYWAHVQTLGGSFDVVIDPELSEAPPVSGGVLSGSFWLCGRLFPL